MDNFDNKIQELIDASTKLSENFNELLEKYKNVVEINTELYEALKMLWKYANIHEVRGVIYPEGSHTDWIDKANKVLAKADGK